MDPEPIVASFCSLIFFVSFVSSVSVLLQSSFELSVLAIFFNNNLPVEASWPLQFFQKKITGHGESE
jgi:hypothetical protein